MAKAIISRVEDLSETQFQSLMKRLPSSGRLSEGQLEIIASDFKKKWGNSEVLPNVINRLMRRKRKTARVFVANESNHPRKGRRRNIRMSKGLSLVVH